MNWIKRVFGGDVLVPRGQFKLSAAMQSADDETETYRNYEARLRAKDWERQSAWPELLNPDELRTAVKMGGADPDNAVKIVQEVLDRLLSTRGDLAFEKNRVREVADEECARLQSEIDRTDIVIAMQKAALAAFVQPFARPRNDAGQDITMKHSDIRTDARTQPLRVEVEEGFTGPLPADTTEAEKAAIRKLPRRRGATSMGDT